jgi:hypothetical protein
VSFEPVLKPHPVAVRPVERGVVQGQHSLVGGQRHTAVLDRLVLAPDLYPLDERGGLGRKPAEGGRVDHRQPVLGGEPQPPVVRLEPGRLDAPVAGGAAQPILFRVDHRMDPVPLAPGQRIQVAFPDPEDAPVRTHPEPAVVVFQEEVQPP